MRITLCGSTKFIDVFHDMNVKLTLRGHIVYSVATSVKGDFKPTSVQKEQLDLIHFKKIDNSDAIYVLDVAGYVGESTRKEIMWAKLGGKKVFYHSTSIDRLSEYGL